VIQTYKLLKIFGFCSFFIFIVCLTTLSEVFFCQQYRNECNNTFLWCIVCSFFVIFSFGHCTVVLFSLCHLVGLMVYGLILHKIYSPNISADNSDWRKKFQGITPTSNFLALISYMHEKWVGLNILGVSALIFLALVIGTNNIIVTVIVKRQPLITVNVISCSLWSNC
jgi:hypothetical protein